MIAVDLFAGWGGTTLGAEAAGARVVWAANHWPLAVQAHALNHPSAVHACQDLRQADWTRVPDHDLLLASPACQGHSTASQPGRRAYHDALRGTAWCVVDAVQAKRPRALIVENVPSFRRWECFDLWLEALRRYGYRLTVQVVSAARCGVPQRRERLLVVGMLGRAAPFLAPALCAEPAIGPAIEWDAGDWRSVSRASKGAQERIAAGRRLGPRYLVQHTTGHRGVSIDEPIRTVTTKDQWAVVDGDRYRPLMVREYARAMGFPDSYGWPAGVSRVDVIKGLGNAVAPPMATLATRAVMEAA